MYCILFMIVGEFLTSYFRLLSHFYFRAALFFIFLLCFFEFQRWCRVGISKARADISPVIVLVRCIK